MFNYITHIISKGSGATIRQLIPFMFVFSFWTSYVLFVWSHINFLLAIDSAWSWLYRSASIFDKTHVRSKHRRASVSSMFAFLWSFILQIRVGWFWRRSQYLRLSRTSSHIVHLTSLLVFIICIWSDPILNVPFDIPYIYCVALRFIICVYLNAHLLITWLCDRNLVWSVFRSLSS